MPMFLYMYPGARLLAGS